MSIYRLDIPLIDTFEERLFETIVHRGRGKHLVIIVPGADGDKDGYKDKYKRMAELLVEEKDAWVIRFSNRREIGLGWTSRLESLMVYLEGNRWLLEGARIDRISMVGYSVGAGIISLVGPIYKHVKGLTLLSPVLITKGDSKLHNLEGFSGRIYQCYGNKDTLVTDVSDLTSTQVYTNIIEGLGHVYRGVHNDVFISYPTKCHRGIFNV